MLEESVLLVRLADEQIVIVGRDDSEVQAFTSEEYQARVVAGLTPETLKVEYRDMNDKVPPFTEIVHGTLVEMTTKAFLLTSHVIVAGYEPTSKTWIVYRETQPHR